jgi:hypothetical protein
MARELQYKITVDDTEGKQTVREFNREISTGGGGTSQATAALEKYEKQVGNVVKSQQAATGAFSTYGQSAATASGQVDKFDKALADLDAALAASEGKHKASAAAMDASSIAALRATYATEGLAAASMSVVTTIATVVAALAPYAIAVMAVVEGLEYLIDHQGQQALTAETAAAKQDVINKAIAEGAPKSIEYGDAVKYVNDQYQHQQAMIPLVALQRWNNEQAEASKKAYAHAEEQRVLNEALADAGIVIGDDIDIQKKWKDAQEENAKATRKIKTEQDAALKSLKDWDDKLRNSVIFGPATPVMVPPVLHEIEEGTGAAYQDLTKLGEHITEVGPVITTFWDQLAGIQQPHGLASMEGSIDKVRYHLRDLGRDLSTLGGVFIDLAHDSRGSFDTIANSIQTAVHVAGIGLQTVGNFMAATTTAGRIAALQQGAAAANQYAQRSGAGPGTLAATGAAQGALGGFTASGFNPYVAAAGAVVGAVQGYYEGRQNEQRDHEAMLATLAGLGGGRRQTDLSNLQSHAHENQAVSGLLGTASVGQIQSVAAGISTLEAHANSAGVSMRAFWRSVQTNDPESTQHAIDDINQALDRQHASMQTLTDTAAKYGLTIDQLGPAMQRQNMDERAQGLYKDFQVLLAGTGDWNLMLGQTADHVQGAMVPAMNDFVQDALRMGTEIPEAMRPMIQRMIEQKTLLNENGDVIQNIEGSGIHFATTMTQGFRDIVDAVHQMTQDISHVLGNGFADAFKDAQHHSDNLKDSIDRIPNDKEIKIHYSHTSDGGGPGGGGEADPPPGVSTGGIITAFGVSHLAGGGVAGWFPGSPMGVDTVPIWAQPGEMFINRTQQGQLFSWLNGRGTPTRFGAGESSGGSGSTRTIIVQASAQVEGREFARIFVPILPDVLAELGIRD